MSLFKLFKNQLVSNVNISEPFYDEIGGKLPTFKELCELAKKYLSIEYDKMGIKLVDSNSSSEVANYIPGTNQKLCFYEIGNETKCYEYVMNIRYKK